MSERTEPTMQNVALTRTDALYALLAGVTGVAGSFAFAGNSAQFVVAPVDDLVVRMTPGAVVAWSIQTLGDSGHLLHLGLSVVIVVAILSGLAVGGILLARRLTVPFVGTAVAGVLAWVFAFGVSGAPLIAIGASFPVAFFTAIGILPPPSGEPDASRRRALISGVGALAFSLLAFGVGRRAPGQTVYEDLDAGFAAQVATLLQQADEQSLDLATDSIPGLVSTIDEFYKVDINQFDPQVEAEDWTLTINGEVDEDVTITYDELRAMPTEHIYLTLRCVGESLNGQKMDTAVWTGTPLKPLLEQADPEGECNCAMLHATDGYSVQVPLAALDDAFLAWGMNGKLLPRAHGKPVRVLVPGHWGETNTKWLDEIELLDVEMHGYWEQRGWRGTGPVNTVAKLWADTRLDDGRIEVAGHAYAGTRGVDSVEVSIDGGQTWTEAEVSEPLPGTDVWRQWRYVFEIDSPAQVVVRAIDGDGVVQPREEKDAFPSGASGWVSKTIRP